MKKVILIGVILIGTLMGCVEDEVISEPDCDKYTNLCGIDGPDYKICCDDYDCWYEAEGNEFTTSDDIFSYYCE